MPGYPNKITRAALGPTYVNSTKIGNPAEEIDAAVFNLMAWQMAGLNLVAPRAVIIGQAENGQPILYKQWLSWDPNGALANTQFTRTGTGVYTWALPGSGTYADMNGNLVVFQADYVDVSVMGATNRNVIADLDSDGNSGSLNCYQADNGVAIDIGSAGVAKRFRISLY